MKKLLLALSIVLAGQSVYAESVELQTISTPGLTGVRITSDTKIEKISAADCTRSTAEAHAYAHPASGITTSRILHRGRHEAIYTNCTGDAALFTMEIVLESDNGERVYADKSIWLSNQSRATSVHDSFFYQTYSADGTYYYTAKTSIRGPATHSATATNSVIVR